MSTGINELKRRTDALGQPGPAAPIASNIPPEILRQIGDILALQSYAGPEYEEWQQAERAAGHRDGVFVSQAAMEKIKKINAILESPEVKE